jgi:hypothetical protein
MAAYGGTALVVAGLALVLGSVQDPVPPAPPQPWPKWSLTKAVTGEVLEEFRVHLGGSAETTKMPENFQLRITRVRERWAK